VLNAAEALDRCVRVGNAVAGTHLAFAIAAAAGTQCHCCVRCERCSSCEQLYCSFCTRERQICIFYQ
jgi:hypothetical protein